MQTTVHQPLARAWWPAEGRQAALRAVLLIALGSALLTLSAKVQVPFWPVEMTMQTFVVLLIGMAYGWRLAGATVLVYLAQGAIGLPVFVGTPAKGIGLAYMAGPTGGYLLGFLLAAVALGWLAERGWGRAIPSTVAAMLAGTALIFIPGVARLAAPIGAERAIQFGLLPFLFGEAVKLALAVAVLTAGRRTPCTA